MNVIRIALHEACPSPNGLSSGTRFLASDVKGHELVMTLRMDLGGVLLEGSTGIFLVPTANITYLELAKAPAEAPSAADGPVKPQTSSPTSEQGRKSSGGAPKARGKAGVAPQ